MATDLVQAALISTLLCGVLSTLAYRQGVLTWDGTVAAFAVGMVIGIFGDLTWLLLLLFFLLSSFLATRYRFALKEAMGVQEGARGERGSTNVFANSIAPMAVAFLSFLNLAAFPKGVGGVVFLAALAVAGADTLASEIGVLSRRTYLITTMERVPAGTDGGVSILGQGCALAAAFYTGAIGWVGLYYLPTLTGLPPSVPPGPISILVPFAIGFLGCQLDSLIGATLEQRGLVSKKMNNFISTSVGAILAFIILLVGWPVISA